MRGGIRHSFTLVEILVAAVSMAVLFAALSVPVRIALRGREDANAADAEAYRLRRVMERVLDDLAGILPPGSELTGDFVGTRNEDQDGCRDSLEFATNAVGVSASTTGTGGTMRVEYHLEESDSGEGYDWLRTETLNPLSESTDIEVDTVMISGVWSLEITYYDGTSWQDSWSTAEGNSGLPEAIAISFSLLPKETDDDTEPEDLPKHRLLVPVLVEESDSGNSRQEEQP